MPSPSSIIICSGFIFCSFRICFCYCFSFRGHFLNCFVFSTKSKCQEKFHQTLTGWISGNWFFCFHSWKYIRIRDFRRSHIENALERLNKWIASNLLTVDLGIRWLLLLCYASTHNSHLITFHLKAASIHFVHFSFIFCFAFFLVSLFFRLTNICSSVSSYAHSHRAIVQMESTWKMFLSIIYALPLRMYDMRRLSISLIFSLSLGLSLTLSFSRSLFSFCVALSFSFSAAVSCLNMQSVEIFNNSRCIYIALFPVPTTEIFIMRCVVVVAWAEIHIANEITHTHILKCTNVTVAINGLFFSFRRKFSAWRIHQIETLISDWKRQQWCGGGGDVGTRHKALAHTLGRKYYINNNLLLCVAIVAIAQVANGKANKHNDEQCNRQLTFNKNYIYFIEWKKNSENARRCSNKIIDRKIISSEWLNGEYWTCWFRYFHQFQNKITTKSSE